MSTDQRETKIQELTDFHQKTLKNKFHLAIERHDFQTIDTLIAEAKSNNFDIINHVSVDGERYYSTMDSILNAYAQFLYEKNKNQNNDKTVDFSLFDKLIQNGLELNKTYTVGNERKDIFDSLFRFNFARIPSSIKQNFEDGLLSRIPVNEMNLSHYLDVVNSNSFNIAPKKDRKNPILQQIVKNSYLFNYFTDKHFKEGIPLNTGKDDLKSLYLLINEGTELYALSSQKIKNILDLFKTETLTENDNFEYVMRLLIEADDKQYALKFLKKHNIDFNKEMNTFYDVHHYNVVYPKLPLMAKLIIKNNAKVLPSTLYEGEVLSFLSDHFKFKYTNTSFSSVFIEEYYLSINLQYPEYNNEVLERMIHKGMDFYSEDLNSGTNIFDYALSHSSARKFMTYLFEKNGWDVNYINSKNKTLADTFIVSNEIAHLIKGDEHKTKNNAYGHYFIEILKKNNQGSFIPDAFFHDALKHRNSYYAKVFVQELKQFASPEFKDNDGYGINPAFTIFPHEKAFSYFQGYELKNRFYNQEAYGKGQNFMHVLFQRKENKNLIQILNKVMKLGSSAWLQKDYDNRTPFYYLQEKKELDPFEDNNNGFDDFFAICSKMHLDFIFERNFENKYMGDVFASYFHMEENEKNTFIAMIEKTKLELSLNTDAFSIDPQVIRKKRL